MQVQGQGQGQGQVQGQGQGHDDLKAATQLVKSFPLHNPYSVKKYSTIPKRFPSLLNKGDLNKELSSCSSRSTSRSIGMGSALIDRSDVGHGDATTQPQQRHVNKPTRASDVSRVKNRNVLRFSEWSWADKELVLKFLFAKINESKHRGGIASASKDSLFASMRESDIGMEGSTERENDGEDKDERHAYELPFFISEGAVDCMPYKSSTYQAAVINSRRDFNFNATY